MTRSTSGAPSLAELTQKFLQQQHLPGDDHGADVEPHEVLAGFRVDPRTAWLESQQAISWLGGVAAASGGMPPEWSAFAMANLGTCAVACAAGNFPQRVRELQPLLEARHLSNLRPVPRVVEGFTALRAWAERSGTVLGQGVLRALNGTTAERGEGVLAQNERAADLWHAGEHQAALDLWLSLPNHPVIAFNRGMCLLFCGRPGEAVAPLEQAGTQLPDDSGWSHLAQLYLALARSQRSLT